MTVPGVPLAAPARAMRQHRDSALARLVAGALIERSPDLIWAVDRSLRLVSANPAFRAFLGLVSGAEPEPGDLMRHEGLPLLAACCERALRGEHVQVELTWGGVVLDLVAAPVADGGRIVAAALHARDVSAARRELADLRRRVAALEAEKDDLAVYAQHVAHDLKNPLSGIATSAQILRKRLQLGLLSNVEVLVDCIDEMAAGGTTTVDDLLRLAHREHRAAQLQPLDLGALAADVCRRLEPQIAERGAEVSAADRWPAAVGQPALVASILENYLSNALKYGGERPVVELGADLGPGGQVRCWVRDLGPGLTPGEQALLFAPFVRLRRDGTDGHGLGLALVRHNAERMGGTAGVESAPGCGARFFFTLPAAEAPGC